MVGVLPCNVLYHGAMCLKQIEGECSRKIVEVQKVLFWMLTVA